mmetsp:Transcript_3481/g.8390  ORF Transcript_3481/g.8390 Transcript_3481/m.8390 type:complete len:405 (+) Transcript_3481:155-1369(+)
MDRYLTSFPRLHTATLRGAASSLESVRIVVARVLLLLLLLLLRLLLLTRLVVTALRLLLPLLAALLPLILLLLLLLVLLLLLAGSLQALVARLPVPRRLLVGPPVLVELPIHNHLLLRLGLRAEAPSPGVRVPLHDNPLDLGNHAVIARRHHRRGHLGDPQRDRLPLCRDHHDLPPHLDSVLKAEEARNHELGAVANGVDGAVLHHDPLVRDQEPLQGEDRAPEVALILIRVVGPLRVEHVVHRHQVVALRHRSRADAPKLLHVPSDAQEEPQVHAHGAHVRARLARDPKDAKVPLHVKVAHLALVDGADAQLPLDRRHEGGALEDGALELLERLGELALGGDGPVEARHRHVLLTRRLLALDEACGALHAHDQAPSHLGVERAGVPRLLHAEDAADPRNHLVG